MNKNKAIESDPEILSRIASLNVFATKLVEGLLSGHHRSRHTGSSVEFSDYKDYTPEMKSSISTGKLQPKQTSTKSNNLSNPPT